MAFPSLDQGWRMFRTAADRGLRVLLRRERNKTLAPGTVAPLFSAAAQDGRSVKLEQLRGSHVVLWFYPKARTFNCTKEGCAFRDLATGFRDRAVVIVGVSFDSTEDNAAFAREQRFPFDLLSDQDRAIGLAYGACDAASDAFPRRITYLIDPGGLVVRCWTSVDVAGHAAQVLDAIPPRTEIEPPRR